LTITAGIPNIGSQRLIVQLLSVPNSMPKEELIATCRALRKNDPRYTKLNLDEYGALLTDQKLVQQVAQALEKNTVVENLCLSHHLCADSTLQLSHFLRSSPSLRSLNMSGKDEDTEEVDSRRTLLLNQFPVEARWLSFHSATLSLESIVL
jgi:hypothetical protein